MKIRIFAVMKYFFRLVVYCAIFCVTFSVSYVLVLRFVPVTVMPIRVIRFWDPKPATLSVYAKWTSLDNISPGMVKAVIASEDGKYLEHRGFDWDAIKFARENNRRSERILGASTISQQTAKNVFCTHKRTWLRKGLETYYTVLIEALWGKRRIMEVYLNIVEMHRGVYGVEAAARRFYDKDAAQLNPYEASMMAAVLPGPLRRDLSKPTKYMIGRASRIRAAMNRLGKEDYEL